MADIVLVNPRFEVSYWGLEHALPLFGKRAALPTACLPLLAALTPAEHRVTLLDENAERLDFGRLARADLVGLTGMSVQRHRMREILRELKKLGRFTVVGGPWVTVEESEFADLADVIFIGEAEETWPQFLREWSQGRHRPRYEQMARTDMTRVPRPRFDLLPMDRYLFGSIQFSRGCPYQCEFCDIIVTFGRRPRLKTSEQILAELEALRAQKQESVFIVDDNLIGNKRGVKPLLRAVAAWQQEYGYPLTFFTEASLDLAEDPELLQLLVDANVVSVFVGIESPNEESLRETRKLQNLRPDRTVVERVHAIQRAGLDVWCGLILGFDHDDERVFEAHREFLKSARILHAMVGMLSAIPKTPLHARLAAEGRLDRDGEREFGTNVIPLQMSRMALRRGYVQLMRDLYEPNSYFERLDDLFLSGEFEFGQSRARYWRRHPWTHLKARSAALARSLFLSWRLMTRLPDTNLRKFYAQRLFRLLRSRREPGVWFVYLLKCALHYHHYTLSREMEAGESRVINTI